MDNLNENLQHINATIQTAAQKSGRSIEDITLITVTKTIDIPTIQNAVSLGTIHLGENKVQEFLSKYDSIPSDVHWHLIGHLQTNKVKYIIPKVKLIHSVDTEKLALEINRKSKECNSPTDILIQVNIAEEDTKYGISPEKVVPLLSAIGSLPYIHVKGLMTIAPYMENPEDNRIYFKQMYDLFIDISNKNMNNIHMEFLSMGMTNDYAIAIEEGSNMVRIGTGIFGSRIY